MSKHCTVRSNVILCKSARIGASIVRASSHTVPGSSNSLILIIVQSLGSRSIETTHWLVGVGEAREVAYGYTHIAMQRLNWSGWAQVIYTTSPEKPIHKSGL